MNDLFVLDLRKTTHFEARIRLEQIPVRERNGTDILLRPFSFTLVTIDDQSVAVGSDTNVRALADRTKNAVACLRKYGYTVKDYEVHDVIMNSARQGDVLNAFGFTPPPGYALVSEDLLRAWGKLEELQAACIKAN